jgi:hypothetical protein
MALLQGIDPGARAQQHRRRSKTDNPPFKMRMIPQASTGSWQRPVRLEKPESRQDRPGDILHVLFV